ncbi:hypothetical protein TPHA_0D00450 [Tetrapisispora phaffii CBS 4417]|uniref:ABC transporter domain-containing protein n=1 Tax=Tetrapisispora phaffii (strain ATCC 24235 / CBS 4417 / NBRC 1672 / NRRL Y-8282 / UCD 70-5) TaxID=1071381 RepID=G8BS68_TETPH|nr:hypothetical protein TPHA_0D00450 [Tetrapisispora phaffii CBS 4417]CCE62689.1 hypothetical protein TPHA_0D00450 [Tetrapisispora phaffii CBS 4417]
MSTSLAVKIDHLTYTFPQQAAPALHDVSLEIPWHTRTLLVGCNGAGKSTILRLLSGKHLCLGGNILVNDHNPFSPLPLDGDAGDVVNCVYLGLEWAHMEIINRDVRVSELLDSIGFAHFEQRGRELLQILEVDTHWRMHMLSDGQKRRVQLVMGLLKPWRVLLLDEVTVDLDVIGRSRLLAFLEHETQRRRCSVLYATHIFDGLNSWPHRVLHLDRGRIVDSLALPADVQFTAARDAEVAENRDTAGHRDTKPTLTVPKSDSLHPLALHWLARDRDRT